MVFDELFETDHTKLTENLEQIVELKRIFNMVVKKAKKAFRNDPKWWFIHNHLHGGNIMIQWDIYTDEITDIKFIDMEYLRSLKRAPEI